MWSPTLLHWMNCLSLALLVTDLVTDPLSHLQYYNTVCIVCSEQDENGHGLHVDLSRGITVYSMMVTFFEANIPSACRKRKDKIPVV